MGIREEKEELAAKIGRVVEVKTGDDLKKDLEYLILICTGDHRETFRKVGSVLGRLMRTIAGSDRLRDALRQLQEDLKTNTAPVDEEFLFWHAFDASE